MSEKKNNISTRYQIIYSNQIFFVGLFSLKMDRMYTVISTRKKQSIVYLTSHYADIN